MRQERSSNFFGYPPQLSPENNEDQPDSQGMDQKYSTSPGWACLAGWVYSLPEVAQACLQAFLQTHSLPLPSGTSCSSPPEHSLLLTSWKPAPDPPASQEAAASLGKLLTSCSPASYWAPLTSSAWPESHQHESCIKYLPSQLTSEAGEDSWADGRTWAAVTGSLAFKISPSPFYIFHCGNIFKMILAFI